MFVVTSLLCRLNVDLFSLYTKYYVYILYVCVVMLIGLRIQRFNRLSIYEYVVVPVRERVAVVSLPCAI